MAQSNYVTNDPSRIDVAQFRRQGVEYVDREDARLLARSTKRTEWDLLAKAIRSNNSLTLNNHN